MPQPTFVPPAGEDAALTKRSSARPTVSPSTERTAFAEGRRTLSTAFVQIGPDGYLTVERHDGVRLLLRNVAMHRRKYCGTTESRGTASSYCGDYAEVAVARPGR